MYDQFSNYWQKNGRGGNAPPPLNNAPPSATVLNAPAPGGGRLRSELLTVASRRQEELQDIVEALGQSKAGPGQWLRTHAGGGRDFTKQDWSRAVAALNIRSTRRWACSAE